MHRRVKYTHRESAAIAGLIVVIAIAALAGCTHPRADSLFDEAFATLYPELTSRISSAFPTDTRGKKNEGTQSGDYLHIPINAASLHLHLEDIYITSPAVTACLPPSDTGTSARALCLLVQKQGYPAVLWDSGWAYREMGLIAGYRTGVLQKKAMPAAKAAVLFARGIGRSEKELNAFVNAFAVGARAAGLGKAESESALSVFDVDSMHLHGDRLEQVMATYAQMMRGSPNIIMLAADSRGTLEKALNGNQNVLADTRGLGKDIPKSHLLAAIGENDAAVATAVEKLVRDIENDKSFPGTIYVKPSLHLSRDARRIQKALRGLNDSGASQ